MLNQKRRDISAVDFYAIFRESNKLHEKVITENWQVGVLIEFAEAYFLFKKGIQRHNEDVYTLELRQPYAEDMISEEL